MNHSQIRLAAAAVTFAWTASASWQAMAQPVPAGSPVVQLRLATGKHGKGFSKVFADIRNVCGNTVPMVEVETEGGLQNLMALAANKADLGFVQVDTFAVMQDSDPNISALQTVMPMNVNLLHVIARSSGYEPPRTTLREKLAGRKAVVVRSFGDLKGLPVAVVGSARSLGRELDRAQALGLQFVDVSTDDEGLAKLKRGDIAALLSTSGWPSGPVQALKRGDGLHLVRFDLKVQEPYIVSTRNYENLDSFKHTFLGVPNVLMTRPFTPSGDYGRAVATLRDCLKKNLVNLREGPYEPMWQEVKADGPAFGGSKVFGAVAR